ncbi:hypothetical protein [Pelosinus sp. UFO1]|uniref:hypothetical protein n=1 Tax=Pelosinus sp. UFO1 TaxID=484770 RepID=UPI0004D1D859|nr:hypothetical protein [Pelosinus sp. UFO1]AIF51995.1 hypothetical protein UFO1_2448 [Pelosinus sp. UFO1]
MAGIHDFYARQGNSFSSGPIQWRRGDTPVDLTNLAGKCQIKTTTQSGVLAEAIVVVTDAVNGWYYFYLTSTQMASIPADGPTPNDFTKYVYDNQWSGAGEYVETNLVGGFYVAAEVTK